MRETGGAGEGCKPWSGALGGVNRFPQSRIPPQMDVDGSRVESQVVRELRRGGGTLEGRGGEKKKGGGGEGAREKGGERRGGEKKGGEKKGGRKHSTYLERHEIQACVEAIDTCPAMQQDSALSLEQVFVDLEVVFPPRPSEGWRELVEVPILAAAYIDKLDPIRLHLVCDEVVCNGLDESSELPVPGTLVDRLFQIEPFFCRLQNLAVGISCGKHIRVLVRVIPTGLQQLAPVPRLQDLSPVGSHKPGEENSNRWHCELLEEDEAGGHGISPRQLLQEVVVFALEPVDKLGTDREPAPATRRFPRFGVLPLVIPREPNRTCVADDGENGASVSVQKLLESWAKS